MRCTYCKNLIRKNILGKKNQKKSSNFMKKYWNKKTFSIVVLVLILLGFIYYLRLHWQDFSSIRISSWASVGLLLIFNLLIFLIQGWFFKVAVKPFGLSLAFNEWFGLVAITTMGNYIFPFAGWGLRGGYLKKRHHLSYGNFLYSTLANWLTNFLIFSLGGLLAVYLIFRQKHQFNWSMLIFFGLVLIFSIIS